MENCVRGRAGGRVREEAGSSLPLPPPPRLAAANSSNAAAAAAAASIRAHLARTASGVDAQPSPRSLLSRILLRGGGGDGGSGGGAFGCRVRLPRRYGGGGLREERKDGAEQGETPRVKVVAPPPPPPPPPPELPLETPRSSLGSACRGRKKPEEELVSMNLGLGASLVLLLSKSAVELNKMVELRAQMEALVSEIRQAARWKEEEKQQQQQQQQQQANQNHPAAAAPAASSTSQESDGGSSSSSATTTAVKDPIAFPAAEAEADAAADTAASGRTAAVVMDLMEAELQAELSRMQQQRGRGGTVLHGHGGGDSRIAPMRGLELPLLKLKTTKKGDAGAPDSASRSCVDDDGGGNRHGDDEVDGGNGEDDDDDEEDDDEEEEEDGGYGEDRMSPPHGGVSARALERRLHELLQKRQQDRIVELESALDAAQRRLHEKEREVVWWRDAAKLVSHRRDESRRIVAR